MYFETGGVLFGTKPFCRGDETVLKQESEYPFLIRLGRPKCNLSSISFGRSRAADTLPQWASRRASGDRGFSSSSRGDQLCGFRCARAGCLSHWLAYMPGEDFVCGPIRGVAMVRRRSAGDINGLRIRAQAYRAIAIVANPGESAFKPWQLKISLNNPRSCGFDPGPAGFDWVEIDFGQTHLDKARRTTGC
jgi:hypothetical protein